eukprot:3081982-Prymnesium_polylepis.1
MRGMRKDYTVAGRTPKTVGAALEAYAASTISFTDDEHFQPNPRGLRGLFELGATIPAETRVRLPYDGRRARARDPTAAQRRRHR